VTAAAARARIDVTDRADDRARAAEKLLAVTAETRFVFRVIGHVGKRFARFSDELPVGRRKLVTRAAVFSVRLEIVRKSLKSGRRRLGLFFRRNFRFCRRRRRGFQTRIEKLRGQTGIKKTRRNENKKKESR
jgi:hypothetical protein